MNINTICLIGFLIMQVVFIVLVYLFITTKVFPYLDKKNELKEREIKNKKFEIFNTINTESITKELDNYFESMINRYIVYKFISKKITYIGSDQIETMINDLTKSAVIEMSELYVYYISMLISISTQEDLVRFVNNKIRNIAVGTVSAYNKSEQVAGI